MLATINQIFSLLDPLDLSLRHRPVRDEIRRSTRTPSSSEVSASCSAPRSVWLSSPGSPRTFRTTIINVITQKLGAQIYSDGIRHSLELPYAVFEDQRSGETLGKLQKVRTDVERLLNAFINILFISLVGVMFVMVYAISVHWLIAPVYFSTIPMLGVSVSVLSRKIKKIQKVIVAETTALAGSTTESLRNIELVKSLGLAQQEISSLEQHDRQDPRARAQEGEVSAQSEFHSRNVRERAAHEPSCS